MKIIKLVRDKIPAIIISKGGKPVYHVASDEEYEKELYKKLREEMGEFFRSGDTEELADMIEVIYAIAEKHGIADRKLESQLLSEWEMRSDTSAEGRIACFQGIPSELRG